MDTIAATGNTATKNAATVALNQEINKLKRQVKNLEIFSNAMLISAARCLPHDAPHVASACKACMFLIATNEIARGLGWTNQV